MSKKGKFFVAGKTAQGQLGILNSIGADSVESAQEAGAAFVGTNTGYPTIVIVKEVLELRPKKEMDVVTLE